MDKIIKPGIVLFIIAAVAATLLGYMYELTLPYIKEQEVKAKTEAMMEVMPEADDFVDEMEVMSDADNFVDEADFIAEGVTSFTVGFKNGEAIGVVVGTSPKGYGGPIDMLTGIDLDGTITGIAIVNMVETPGLGLNADKEEFKNKFIGKSGELTVVKGVPNDSQIDAMTSATITTQAIVNGVNTSTKAFETTGKEVVK